MDIVNVAGNNYYGIIKDVKFKYVGKRITIRLMPTILLVIVKSVALIAIRTQKRFGRREAFMGNSDNIADSVLTYILGVLENRREQIAERSTVSLAASSGLFVLIVGFITDALKKDEGSHQNVVICLVVSLILTSISIITTLNLVKKISRKKNQKKIPDSNMLFFGWIADKNENDLYEKYSQLSNDDYIKAQVRQAISLSKNLRYRYNQLKKTYIFFILGLIVYIISIVLNILYIYNIVDGIVARTIH